MNIPEGLSLKSGVYQILNTTTNKCYVGSSKNIYKRLWTHNKDLTRNTHYNSYLQRTYNKYLSSSFTVNVLEYCEVELLATKEKEWIDRLNSYNNGYNLCPNTYTLLGTKQSQETIEKRRLKLKGRKFPKEFGEAVSKRMKGIKRSEETIRKFSEKMKGRVNKKEYDIVQYDLSGNVIKYWRTVKEINKSLNISTGGICECLTGKKEKTKGFIFKRL